MSIENPVREAYVHTEQTDEELRHLAMHLVHGNIFGSWDCPDTDILRMVFLTVGLYTTENLQELKDAGVHGFYEYMDKAGPRTINDYPMFLSVKFLSKNEMEKMSAYCDQLIKIEESFLEGEMK